jgi:hypothetical protein
MDKPIKKIHGKVNSRRYVVYYDVTIEILKDTDWISASPYGSIRLF